MRRITIGGIVVGLVMSIVTIKAYAYVGNSRCTEANTSCGGKMSGIYQNCTGGIIPAPGPDCGMPCTVCKTASEIRLRFCVQDILMQTKCKPAGMVACGTQSKASCEQVPSYPSEGPVLYACQCPADGVAGDPCYVGKCTQDAPQ